MNHWVSFWTPWDLLGPAKDSLIFSEIRHGQWDKLCNPWELPWTIRLLGHQTIGSYGILRVNSRAFDILMDLWYQLGSKMYNRFPLDPMRLHGRLEPLWPLDLLWPLKSSITRYRSLSPSMTPYNLYGPLNLISIVS